MDSAGRPIRRRRRPMSSCEQCRRRKVKCDQKSPCDQCIRSKCDSCVYHRFQPASTKSAQSPTDEGYWSPRVQEFLKQNGLDAPAPGANVSEHSTYSSTVIGRLAEAASSNNTSVAACTAEGQSVTALQKKINDLERELTVARQAEEQVSPSQCYPDTPNLKGVVSKTRLMGRSHFMYIIKQGYVSVVGLFESLHQENPSHGLLAGVDKCKRLGKAIKDKNQWHQPLSADLKSYVPSKDVCDVLLKTYFRTFESVYRILHEPSFYDDYNKFWAVPDKATPPFMIKFLLALAIGASFQYGQESMGEVRESARRWVHVAHSWLAFPFTEKHVVSISGVQIYCLLLLAREILDVGSDMIWLATGSLLRTANIIGLHRDPSNFPGMSEFQIEMRRRLWATVTEICFQSSMSAGGLPLVDLDDGDCLPPRNLNDDQIGESLRGTPVERDVGVMTQSTIQRLLAESLPIRLQIAAALNNTMTEFPYAETNRLGLELSQLYQKQLKQLASMHKGHIQPTAFQMRMLKLMNVGALGVLHMPYGIQARKDPSYFFSRKTCLDVALAILTPDDQSISSTAPDSDSVRDSRCLEVVGGGFFRGLSTISAMMIYGELLSQDGSMSMFMSAAEAAVRQEMHRAIDHFIELTLDRLKAGERNIKGHLFSAAIRAQLDAKEKSLPLDQEILKALQEALDRCVAILEARAGTVQTPASEVMSLDPFSLDNFPPDMIPEPFWWDELDFDYQDMNFNRAWNPL